MRINHHCQQMLKSDTHSSVVSNQTLDSSFLDPKLMQGSSKSKSNLIIPKSKIGKNKNTSGSETKSKINVTILLLLFYLYQGFCAAQSLTFQNATIVYVVEVPTTFVTSTTMKPTNITSKRKCKVHSLSKVTAKLRHFYHTLGGLSRRLCNHGGHRNYTRLPKHHEAKNIDTCSTTCVAKELQDTKHVAVPRDEACTHSLTDYLGPFYCHMSSNLQNQYNEFMSHNLQNQSNELVLNDSRWGNNHVTRSNGTMYNEYKSGNDVWPSEDEYEYEVNKWSVIGGFRTRYTRNKFD